MLSSGDHILSNTEAVHSCMGYSVIVDFYLVPTCQMDPSGSCMFSAGATLCQLHKFSFVAHAALFLLIYCLKEGKGEVLSGASFVLFYRNRSYFTQVKEPMFGFWLLLNIFISIMYSRARYITRWWICRPIGPTVRRTWTWTPFIIWTVYASTVTGWPYKYFGYPGVNGGLGTVSSSPWMGWVSLCHHCLATLVDGNTPLWRIIGEAQEDVSSPYVDGL